MSSDTLNDFVKNDFQNISVIQNYNSTKKEVNGEEWDYVLSFFKEAMLDDISAENFAHQIYQVSIQSETPVTEIINTMKGKNGLALSMDLAYYLNGNRSPSTLLGVHNIPKPNFYASRNVLI